MSVQPIVRDLHLPVPPSTLRKSSVELFSGCGGLALGLSKAGLEHKLLVECNENAHNTVRHNKNRLVQHVHEWPYKNEDVRKIDWTQFGDEICFVAGGPPCQPFSIGGKANGENDDRDMWPEAVRAVRETLPEAFLFENVKGLLRPKFSGYVDWIANCLSHPTVIRKAGESHESHLDRMYKAHTKSLYHVQVIPVNAADYGAPQKRLRVLFVGFRKDLVADAPIFPPATHSQERLVWDKWISGEYWHKHQLLRPLDTQIPSQELKVLHKLRTSLFEPATLPWVTCRDALRGLGEPGLHQDVTNHKFQPGAKSYPGHTGSPIDEPAKALKAGVHGVPGGENMLLLQDGSVRYFSVREAARLQGMPDDFEFPGSWTESMRQLGNAVPVQLAQFAGEWIFKQLASFKSA